MIITLIYADNTRVDKEVSRRANRAYGCKLNSKRPIRILIPSEARPELRYYLETIIHPAAKEPRIVIT